MDNTERQQKILALFYKSLSQESHILTKHPWLFWQQIYNRLSWISSTEEFVPNWEEIELQKPNTPWIKSKIPPKESSNLVKVIEGHSNSVTGCAFGQSNDQALSVSSDGTIRFWNLNTGSATAIIQASDTLFCCDWSENGEFFAAGSKRGDVYLGRMGNNSPSKIKGHEDYIYCCSFSPSSRYLITGSGDRTLRLWDVGEEKEYTKFTGHTSGIIRCLFSRDEKKIISTSNDLSLIVWDLDSGKQLYQIKEDCLAIQALAISPDNNYLLTGCADRTLTMWDFEMGERIITVRIPQKLINACKFSPYGNYIVYAGDMDLVICNSENLQVISTLAGHSKQIKDFCFSPNGNLLLSASQDNTLRLWQIKENDQTTKNGNNIPVIKSLFHDPGEDLLAGCENGNLEIFNANTGETKKTITAHENSVLDINLDISRKLLISGSQDNTVALWNMDSYQKIKSYHYDGSLITKCVSLITKNAMVIVSRDSYIRVVDPETGKLLGEYKGGDFCCSPDESKMAITDSGMLSRHELTLVDLNTKKVVSKFSGHTSPVTDFKFSNKGDKLITSSKDHTVRVWDCSRMVNLFTFSHHGNEVISIDCSPNDQLVSSLSDDGHLIVWKMTDGEIIQDIETKIRITGECKFSPDVSLIMAGGDSQWLTVWQLKDGTQLAAIPTYSPIKNLNLHPARPIITCVDHIGNLYLLNLNNTHYGPIIITPLGIGNIISYQCPSCQETNNIKLSELGNGMNCQNSNCTLPIMLNPFYHHLSVQEIKSTNQRKGLWKR